MKNKKHSFWYQCWSSALSLPFIIFNFLLAGLCYLVEHLYNFCRGKGWIGRPFF